MSVESPWGPGAGNKLTTLLLPRATRRGARRIQSKTEKELATRGERAAQAAAVVVRCRRWWSGRSRDGRAAGRARGRSKVSFGSQRTGGGKGGPRRPRRLWGTSTGAPRASSAGVSAPSDPEGEAWGARGDPPHQICLSEYSRRATPGRGSPDTAEHSCLPWLPALCLPSGRSEPLAPPRSSYRAVDLSLPRDADARPDLLFTSADLAGWC